MTNALGNRYGEIDRETGMSYTEKEYKYAIAQNIPCLSFISKSSVAVLPEYLENDEKREKLQAFRAEAARGRMVDFWSNPDDLSTKVVGAISLAIQDSPRPGWIRNPITSPEVAEELARLSKRNADLEGELAFLRRPSLEIPTLDFEFNSGQKETEGSYVFQAYTKASIAAATHRAYEMEVKQLAELLSSSAVKPKNITPSFAESEMRYSTFLSKKYEVSSSRIAKIKSLLDRYKINRKEFDWTFDLVGELIMGTIGGIPTPTTTVSGGRDYQKYKAFAMLEDVYERIDQNLFSDEWENSRINLNMTLKNISRIAARNTKVKIDLGPHISMENLKLSNPHSFSQEVSVLSPSDSYGFRLMC